MGRRRLRGGFSVWLPDHRATDGVLFRRYLKAGAELLGGLDGSELHRVEVRHYAIAGVVYERAARVWGEAAERRENGLGRRPSSRDVERAARRLGLAEQTFTAAAQRLEALAGERKPLDTAKAIAAAQTGGSFS